MDGIDDQLASLVEFLEQTRVGDISTMAGLLHEVDAVKTGAAAAGRPNLSVLLEAIGEVVKKIIMDAVADAEAAFGLVTASLGKLPALALNTDLSTFEGFPQELNLPDPVGSGEGDAVASKSSEWIDDSIVAEFLDQHTNSLGDMESMILKLEQGPNPEALSSVQRIVHTMKGEAGFLGLQDIEMVCHAAEDFLEADEFPYDIETILAVKDWMASALADLRERRPIEKTAAEILPRLSTKTPGAPPVENPWQETTEEASAEGAILEVQENPGAADNAPSGNLQHEAVEPEMTAAEASENILKDSPFLQPLAPRPGLKASQVEVNVKEMIPKEGFWRLSADASLLLDFVSESREHMEHANGELLNLETDPTNQEALNSVFRAFHTIKGIASFLELEEIRVLSHDAENLLDLIRKGSLKITRGVIDIAFDAMDMIGAMIEKVKISLEKDGTMKPEEGLAEVVSEIRAAARGEMVEPAVESTIGGRLGEILVDSGAVTENDISEVLKEERANPTGTKLGELLVKKKDVSAKNVADALRRQRPEGATTAAQVEMRETIRVDYDRLESMVTAIGELIVAEAMITQDEDVMRIHSDAIGKKLHNLRMISRQLQELGTTIRMVPIAGTFQKMARLVRDLSKKTGKKIDFRTQGEETELDRAYVDKIGDPLVHMIRNSVDHGIEVPRQRAATGKKEQAEIQLQAYHEGGNIIIEVRDDGKGIDKEAVRSKAMERGLINEDDRLTDNEIFNLIFQPGFSTAAQITDVSGRGVGMDVVKRNVTELRGQILINSVPGEGSTFRIMLPLTMALIDGMVVRVGRERFIFPVLSVIESMRVENSMLHNVVGRGEMISLRNRQLSLYRLGELFKIPDAKFAIDETLVVVLEYDGKQIGMLVDELVGIQQTVIKNLGSGMGQTDGIAGGAIMADGMIGLIVDVAGLFRLSDLHRREPKSKAGNGGGKELQLDETTSAEQQVAPEPSGVAVGGGHEQNPPNTPPTGGGEHAEAGNPETGT